MMKPLLLICDSTTISWAGTTISFFLCIFFCFFVFSLSFNIYFLPFTSVYVHVHMCKSVCVFVGTYAHFYACACRNQRPTSEVIPHTLLTMVFAHWSEAQETPEIYLPLHTQH